MVGRYIDEFGKPIEKKPNEFPYSFDGYVVWRGGANKEANNTIYSDRLLRWDYEKYNRLSKKHFGNEHQMWSSREPSMIEAFLKDWCEDENLKLVFVMQYCNQSNGYPYWRFDFHSKKESND